MRRFGVALATLLCALATASPGSAGGPKMLVGAAEDVVKQPTVLEARAKLNLLRLAGFDSVRVTSIWDPGEEAPPNNELAQLRAVAGAAKLTGTRVFVAVYPFGSRTTPTTVEAQDEFAVYTAAIAREIPSIRDFIVGNEPNLNRFWLPQFGPAGENVAAPAYLSLLARTYDRLKAVSPQVNVIGGALSPRGNDNPTGGRHTHSPTKFIRDMGVAYRAMNRPLPVMDWFAIHPYPDTPATPPSLAHPNTTTIGIADYGKLVALLGEAFDGTAQPGTTLPILYAEFGTEALIPPAKSGLYTGREPATVKPVDEATQARYYREAIALSFCQPNVVGIFIFHAFDEHDLDRFQSGVYYADEQPKSSLQPTQLAARDARGGVIASCPGLQLTPTATARYPTARQVAAGQASVQVTCDVDCAIYARLIKLPRGSTTFSKRAVARAGERTTVTFPARRVARGRYYVSVSLTARANAGTPGHVASRPFLVP